MWKCFKMFWTQISTVNYFKIEKIQNRTEQRGFVSQSPYAVLCPCRSVHSSLSRYSHWIFQLGQTIQSLLIFLGKVSHIPFLRGVAVSLQPVHLKSPHSLAPPCLLCLILYFLFSCLGFRWIRSISPMRIIEKGTERKIKRRIE